MRRPKPLEDLPDGFYYVRGGIGMELQEQTEVGREYIRDVWMDVFYGKLQDPDAACTQTDDRIIGRVEGVQIKRGKALCAGVSLLEMADNISQYMYEFVNTFIDDKNDEIKKGVPNGAEQLMDDLLLVENVVLDKEFRGFDLGHLMLWRFVDIFAESGGFVVIDSWPIQFQPDRHVRLSREFQLGVFNTNKTQATKKVTKYWAELGADKYRSRYLTISLQYENKKLGAVIERAREWFNSSSEY